MIEKQKIFTTISKSVGSLTSPSLKASEFYAQIDKLSINTHIHGKVECLNDIKLSIKPDSYDWISNSNHKNKKKIICGETKYFYDYYTRRMFNGVVWHNINNMWWVISGGKLKNICANDLFDFEKSMPKRKPVSKNEVESLLSKFEKKRDYIRCANILKQHQKSQPVLQD